VQDQNRQSAREQLRWRRIATGWARARRSKCRTRRTTWRAPKAIT
jgi:hypothetical protein